MKFIFQTNLILQALHKIISISKGKKHFPILNYILLKIFHGYLYLVANNLETEIISKIVLDFFDINGAFVIHATKFFDICKNFSTVSLISVVLKNNKINITAHYTQFILYSLPVCDFPNFEKPRKEIQILINSTILKNLIDCTKFSMAINDLRYYLNGMLFKISHDSFATVSTDGHRLSISSFTDLKNNICYSVIIPRKSILELSKILSYYNTIITLKFSNTLIRIMLKDCIFTSKLINENFPNYIHILPKKFTKVFQINRIALIYALNRVSILSNEKIRSVRFLLLCNKLIITSNNQIKEKAEEVLDIVYNFDKIEIGFNILYLLDIINVIKDKKINFFLVDKFSAVKIIGCENQDSVYILMPIRL